MDSEQLRNRYLKFFEKRDHIIIPSARLVPENDPTTLFTGSGMQPILPYLLGEKHPLGTRLVNSQKCFRAEDVDEVGDNRHTTFFEMLGNWSLGDYFKKEQLTWFFGFLVDDLGINPERLYVTAFLGDEKLGLSRDQESVAIWKELFGKKGIDAKDVELGSIENGYQAGMQGGRIFYYDSSKNWWSRSGRPEMMPEGEPGGPDSEVFYEFKHIAHDPKFGPNCHPNCDCGRFMEIGNSVFMEFKKVGSGFEKLPQRNVDFGGGLERITAALLDCSDLFKIKVFQPVIDILSKASEQNYDRSDEATKRYFRIIADHLRASVFMIADGIRPSNKERGYVLRRLIRRALLASNRLNIKTNAWISEVVASLSESYGDYYNEIEDGRSEIEAVLIEEADKFTKSLEAGLRQFERAILSGRFDAESIFDLFQSYGFPIELSLELAKERNVSVSRQELDRFLEEHRSLSRAGSEKKFKGGLADSSEMSIKYHTATHLLNAALRAVLGPHVYQKGSNITAERLRFDFPNESKLSSDQLKAVEDLVNEKIREGLPVSFEEMPLEQAQQAGVVGVFGEKYPPVVKVYRIGRPGEFFSQEICGGPHVSNTSELGSFRIKKEEAVSAGTRRIKAVLE